MRRCRRRSLRAMRGMSDCWLLRLGASMRNARLISNGSRRISQYWTSMSGAMCARLLSETPDETSMDCIRAGGHDLGCVHGEDALPSGGFDSHGTELRSAVDAIGRRSFS